MTLLRDDADLRFEQLIDALRHGLLQLTAARLCEGGAYLTTSHFAPRSDSRALPRSITCCRSRTTCVCVCARSAEDDDLPVLDSVIEDMAVRQLVRARGLRPVRHHFRGHPDLRRLSPTTALSVIRSARIFL